MEVKKEVGEEVKRMKVVTKMGVENGESNELKPHQLCLEMVSLMGEDWWVWEERELL